MTMETCAKRHPKCCQVTIQSGTPLDLPAHPRSWDTTSRQPTWMQSSVSCALHISVSGC